MQKLSRMIQDKHLSALSGNQMSQVSSLKRRSSVTYDHFLIDSSQARFSVANKKKVPRLNLNGGVSLDN